jgi:hypothetical protein
VAWESDQQERQLQFGKWLVAAHEVQPRCFSTKHPGILRFPSAGAASQSLCQPIVHGLWPTAIVWLAQRNDVEIVVIVQVLFEPIKDLLWGLGCINCVGLLRQFRRPRGFEVFQDVWPLGLFIQVIGDDVDCQCSPPNGCREWIVHHVRVSD